MWLFKERSLFFVSLALACDILLRYCRDRNIEPGANLFCWIGFLAYSNLVDLRPTTAKHAGIYSWIAGVGIAFTSAAEAFQDVQFILVGVFVFC
jgi:hypothetical protein